MYNQIPVSVGDGSTNTAKEFKNLAKRKLAVLDVLLNRFPINVIDNKVR